MRAKHPTQVAALCFRDGHTLEVLLVTSRTRGRWILPKGWIKSRQSKARNAAREAFEEAGVRGEIASRHIGQYTYRKMGAEGPRLRVAVFPLEVARQYQDWPERDQRKRVWVPIQEAAARISEPAIKRILARFASQRSSLNHRDRKDLDHEPAGYQLPQTASRTAAATGCHL